MDAEKNFDHQTINEVESFDRIYREARRATVKASEAQKERLAGQLSPLERSIIRFPGTWMFGVTAAVAMTAAVVGWLRASIITVPIIMILAQVGYIVLLIRLLTFKGSISGVRKFYSEARFLHRAYSEEGRKIKSLHLALDTYIADQNMALTALAGLGATLALYVSIDDAGFTATTKALDKLLNAFFFVGPPLSNRQIFFLLFTGLFSFAMLKFYFPKVWAEQVKRNLDYICAGERDQ